MENELQNADKSATKTGEKEPKISKVLNFRLPLALAIEVKRELEDGTFEGCNTLGAFVRRCIELRHINAAERQRVISAAVKPLLALEPSRRELLAAGFDWERLKPR